MEAVLLLDLLDVSHSTHTGKPIEMLEMSLLIDCNDN